MPVRTMRGAQLLLKGSPNARGPFSRFDDRSVGRVGDCHRAGVMRQWRFDESHAGFCVYRVDMTTPTKQHMTMLLQAVSEGDSHATEELLPLVYDELQKLARSLMAREGPDHTL